MQVFLNDVCRVFFVYFDLVFDKTLVLVEFDRGKHFAHVESLYGNRVLSRRSICILRCKTAKILAESPSE